jgi:hypothetical protein
MTMRNWLCGIRSTLIGKSRASRRKSQQTWGTSAEVLEIRQVPTAAVLQAGILTITGSDQADNIVVTKTGTNLVVSGVRTTFAVSKVKSVVVNAGGGDDTVDLTALTVKAKVSGGAGNDSLIGGSGNDTLMGEAGNDTLTGNAGNDSLDGGADVDQVRESANVNFALTNSRLTGRGTDTLVGIEAALLQGGSSNNRLDASKFSGAVSLLGGAGNDTLIGGTNDDQLYGELGSDSIDGGAGFDTVDGVGDFGSWNTEQILGQSATPVVTIPTTVTIGGVVVQPPGKETSTTPAGGVGDPGSSLNPPQGGTSNVGGVGGGNAAYPGADPSWYNSGQGRYVVVRGDLHNINAPSRIIYDNFPTLEAAKAAARILDQNEPRRNDWLWQGLERREAQSAGAVDELSAPSTGTPLPPTQTVTPAPSPSTTFFAFCVSAWDAKLNKPVYVWFNSTTSAMATAESWRNQTFLPGGALRGRAEPRYVGIISNTLSVNFSEFGVDSSGILVNRYTGERMFQVYP